MLEKFIVEIKKNKPSTDELNIQMDIGREGSVSETKNKTEEYAQDVAQKVKKVKKRKGKSCGRQIKKLQHLSSGSHRERVKWRSER